MKVFVSYSRCDKVFVDRLQTRLTKLGYDVWTDVDDMDGMMEDDWWEAVVTEISETDVMVLVLSPDSTTSDSVKQEMKLAKADSKRIVPILHRECELYGAFKFALLDIHYIDFVEYGFEEGVKRLTTRLDRPADTATEATDGRPEGEAGGGTKIITNEDPSGGGRGGGGRGGGGGGGGDGGPSWRDALEDHKGALVAGACVLLVAIGVLLFAATRDSATSTNGQEDAEAVVTAWADATTRRDFDEAARIDPAHSPEYLEMLYRAADDPVRMISVQPYIADATQEGSLWRLEGAAMALDFNEEPTMRTHVICSEWMVDLEAGTATWTEGTGEFFEGQQIPSEEFAATYDAVCT